MAGYELNKVRNTVKHILVEIHERHLPRFHSEKRFLYTVWKYKNGCMQKRAQKKKQQETK